MANASPASRSYRCFFSPKGLNGYPVATDSGILPFVQVRATDAEAARRAAHHVTGCPVSNVERLDEVAA